MKKYLALKGFTLVELLVVITIIAILAALTLRTVAFVQDKAARERANGEISALSSALERYNADNGEYPYGTNTDTSSAGSNGFLYAALCPTNTNAKIYYDFSKTMTNVTVTSTNIVDPWGNSYGYQYPGDTNKNGTNLYDLWTTANKPSTTNAWIKNW